MKSHLFNFNSVKPMCKGACIGAFGVGKEETPLLYVKVVLLMERAYCLMRWVLWRGG
ncbi:hypothetical protein L6R29_10595 [Myxococcota bacterium]|nr:hypothetical protein [Myxococcota bacterium]